MVLVWEELSVNNAKHRNHRGQEWLINWITNKYTSMCRKQPEVKTHRPGEYLLHVWPKGEYPYSSRVLRDEKDKHLNREVGREQKGISQEKYTWVIRKLKACHQGSKKETQMNATLRYHLWIIRLAKTKKNGNAEARKDKGKEQTLITCWRVYKLERPFRRATWHSVLKLLT